MKWFTYAIAILLWDSRQVRRLFKGLPINRTNKPQPPEKP